MVKHVENNWPLPTILHRQLIKSQDKLNYKTQKPRSLELLHERSWDEEERERPRGERIRDEEKRERSTERIRDRDEREINRERSREIETDLKWLNERDGRLARLDRPSPAQSRLGAAQPPPKPLADFPADCPLIRAAQPRLAPRRRLGGRLERFFEPWSLVICFISQFRTTIK